MLKITQQHKTEHNIIFQTLIYTGQHEANGAVIYTQTSVLYISLISHPTLYVWGHSKNMSRLTGGRGHTGCDKVLQRWGSVALRDVTPVEFLLTGGENRSLCYTLIHHQAIINNGQKATASPMCKLIMNLRLIGGKHPAVAISK